MAAGDPAGAILRGGITEAPDVFGDTLESAVTLTGWYAKSGHAPFAAMWVLIGARSRGRAASPLIATGMEGGRFDHDSHGSDSGREQVAASPWDHVEQRRLRTRSRRRRRETADHSR
jgi:hypothetical protein